MKILDPACGSGSFLIGAYQYLLNWYLDAYAAADPASLASGKNPPLRPTDTGGWALTIAERKRILLDHIHGVDLDAQAVEVTKLNLLLKCLEGETSQSLGFEQRLFKERALPDLAQNILCGNSLIGTDIIATPAWQQMSDDERQKINPFDYERAFPKVFKGKNPGFDAVIGNPPYVLAQSLDSERVFNIFATTFAVAKYKIDTYHLFVERGILLTNVGGMLGYIVPNTFVRNQHALELRKLVLSHSVPRILRLFDYNVFSASVDTAVLITERSKWNAQSVVNVIHSKAADDFASISTPLANWHTHPKLEFLSSAGAAADALANKISQSGPRLGEFATAYFGIQTYDRTAYVADHPLAKSYRPVIDGRCIARYALGPHSEYMDFRPEAIKSGGNPDVYAKERIGVRQIGRVPVGTLLPAGLLTLNTIYNIYLLRPCAYSLRGILGVMLSKVGQFYWLINFCDQKKTFPKVKKPDLLAIPLPSIERKQAVLQYDGLVTLVTSMLSLHTRLSAEQLPQRRDQLQREIDATDRRIDQIVYQLYGLNDDEIRIVEEATG